MLNNSADIMRRLEREGWECVRVAGSHHVFKKPGAVTLSWCRIRRRISDRASC
ncbi:type II toxin-antitoxin system HicA family toxin [Bosea sp. (in: a-proteobacteria)]|uniref:type II toxin-antitoxin system HicA family toxin n=1 Tax=Bosea sp. (in: a-proteobacteria) TaxID=1871050 RepID=UPI003341ECA4